MPAHRASLCQETSQQQSVSSDRTRQQAPSLLVNLLLTLPIRASQFKQVML